MINLFLSLVLALSSFSPALAVARPNVLVITMDDQRWDSVNRMSNVTNRIVKQGISFANAFTGTPLCGPARASGLTGLHARNHGVIENSIPLNRQTWLKSLQDIGYKTASIGKYMHSSAKPPGIDRWVFVGTQYTDPFINVDGKRIQHFGYTPYIVADYAIRFIQQQEIAGRPWAMFLGLQPPHLPAKPASEDTALFANELLPRPPSFNEADISDKWFKRLPLTTDQISGLAVQHRRRLQSLVSADRAIGWVLDELASHGVLNNTLIIFIGDNGWLLGEHRLNTKLVPYEESIRVPLAVRFPPRISSSKIDNRIAASMDVAPTIYQVVGISPPYKLDGRSLIEPSYRSHLLIEFWGGNIDYSAVRTKRHIYTRWRNGAGEELYDLVADPYQLNSVARNPAFAGLKSELLNLLNSYGPRP